MTRQFIGIHGQTHATGGPDPIPGGSGIQFDTDNEGGYLDITSNALDADGHAIKLVTTKADANHSDDPPAVDVLIGWPITGTGLNADTGRLIFSIPTGIRSTWDFIRKSSGSGSGRTTVFRIGNRGQFYMNQTVEGGGQIFNAASVQAEGFDLAPADQHQSTFIGGFSGAGPPTNAGFLTAQICDFVVDTLGDIWVCLVGGNPGTWKRVRPYNSGTTTSSATPTINTDRTDVYEITALAANITSFTTNLSGTPIRGQRLHVAITDDGTSRTLAWGAKFENSTVVLPAATVISTRLDVDLIWNPVTTAWRCLQVS